jgi:hypothetical protein
MKTLIQAILLIIWMVFSLILVFSIVGIVVIILDEWLDIGRKLTDKIIE